VPTLSLSVVGGNAIPVGVQISDLHHGDAIAAVGGLPICFDGLLVPIGRIAGQLSRVVFKAQNQLSFMRDVDNEWIISKCAIISEQSPR
jgi:hypothetical protein